MIDDRTEQERKDAEELYYASERRMRSNRTSAMIVFYSVVTMAVAGLIYGLYNLITL